MGKWLIFLPTRFFADFFYTDLFFTDKVIWFLVCLSCQGKKEIQSIFSVEFGHLCADTLKMAFIGYVSNVSEHLVSLLIFTQKKSSWGALLYFANVILGRILLYQWNYLNICSVVFQEVIDMSFWLSSLR